MSSILKLSIVAVAAAIPEDCTVKYDIWNARYGTSSMSDPKRIVKKRAFCNNLEAVRSSIFDPLRSPFGAMTPQEFADLFHLRENGKFLQRKVRSLRGRVSPRLLQDDAPEACSHLGSHTPSRVKEVQDQRGCGSCWAFAIAGACEGTAAVMGFDVKLSESWLLGCTWYGDEPPAHAGCQGGNMPMVMESIIEKDDVIPDADLAHPYQPSHEWEGNHPQCKENQLYDRGVKLVRHTPEIPVLSVETEYDMKILLCQRGPLMVALDATNLQFYAGGIIETDEDCAVPERLNHAVTLVAFDSDSYTLKNSWGTTWGEEGFFRVTTGKECMGVGTVVDVCKPGPISRNSTTSTPSPTESTTAPTTTQVSTTTSTQAPTTTKISSTTSTQAPTTTKVSTTTSTQASTTTQVSDPCSAPSGYCEWACTKGWPFLIERLC